MARRSDHTREEIKEMAIIAAETIVGREGYKGLSARKVAADIGYTVGTLYLVFENLNDLIIQVNDRTLAELNEAMKASIDGLDGAQERVLALSRAYIDFATHRTHRWRMIYEHIHPDNTALPDWYRRRIESMFEPVGREIAVMMPEAAPVACRKATHALWCGVHGICILGLTGKLDVAGADSVRVMVDLLVENYLRGLLKERC
ncbi:MAG: TetR/AcrR family transcriptional regulator [Gammaproteobacteria bacterium]|nr:TetR/AcrR family transcriptional regulator [Gammaproteobacteria bacterium]